MRNISLSVIIYEFISTRNEIQNTFVVFLYFIIFPLATAFILHFENAIFQTKMRKNYATINFTDSNFICDLHLNSHYISKFADLQNAPYLFILQTLIINLRVYQANRENDHHFCLNIPNSSCFGVPITYKYLSNGSARPNVPNEFAIFSYFPTYDFLNKGKVKPVNKLCAIWIRIDMIPHI